MDHFILYIDNYAHGFPALVVAKVDQEIGFGSLPVVQRNPQEWGAGITASASFLCLKADQVPAPFFVDFAALGWHMPYLIAKRL